MSNRESRILKLRKVKINSILYAKDEYSNDLYDYKLAEKGIALKIGKLAYNPTRVILLDDSTGKTHSKNSTGDTTIQKGGIKKSKTKKKSKKFRKLKKK